MEKNTLFELKDLKVSVEGQEVLKGINLSISAGEVHAFMGPNGSGKTTLSYVLMGHPRYKVESGKILFEGEEIQGLGPDERARKGMFLGFQYPISIPGLSVANFLRSSIRSVRGDEIPKKEVRQRIKQELEKLQIPESFMTRSLNEGFSGGEKKKMEVLQLRLLEPKLGILDETDSGLDIDALKCVAQGISDMRGSNRSFLLITHYQRLLDHIKPDHVHILMDGLLVKSGGAQLAKRLEEKGYEWIANNPEAA